MLGHAAAECNHGNRRGATDLSGRGNCYRFTSQALEAVSGVTGLDYVVKGDGVYLWNQSAGVGATSASDSAVGLLQLDNGMQVMLRRSSPPDAQEYIEHRKA